MYFLKINLLSIVTPRSSTESYGSFFILSIDKVVGLFYKYLFLMIIIVNCFIEFYVLSVMSESFFKKIRTNCVEIRILSIMAPDLKDLMFFNR